MLYSSAMHSLTRSKYFLHKENIDVFSKIFAVLPKSNKSAKERHKEG